METENAKKEFLKEVADKKVKCAKIGLDKLNNYESNPNWFILKKGYSKKEYDEFLQKLDFEYDDGFGSQELFGVIWFVDGTWSERFEYDGSERWDYKKAPSFKEIGSN